MSTELSQLASGFKRGEVEFDRLYAGLRTRLAPVASRYRIIGHDSEDLMQISIISIYRSIGRYKDDTCFDAFATTIAKRRIIDIIRAIQVRGEPFCPQKKNEPDDENRDDTYQHERVMVDHPILKLIMDEEVAIRDARLAAMAFESKERKKPKPKLRPKLQPPAKPDVFKVRIKRLSDGQVYETIYDAARDNRATKRSLLNAAKFGYTCAKGKWRLV